MSEFQGARGSNTGDDFHELWATRQAIRLLGNEEKLEAVTVEGLPWEDEITAAGNVWAGVDCALYYGGICAATAERVVIAQLKYSAASPSAPWTIARLVSGQHRNKSVLFRLALAWKSMAALRQSLPIPEVALVTNQPINDDLFTALIRVAEGIDVPKEKPGTTSAPELRLAYASGLTTAEFQDFAASLRFEGKAGSRFAIEEQILRAIGEWTAHDIQHSVVGLRQFVRDRMRPEFAGERITRESVMLHLGASEMTAIYPCPSEIVLVDNPVSRASVCDAADRLLQGAQHVCLHGQGGVGKTTALQEIRSLLPPGSVMITYDCYGGGRYMDPSALRHRSVDAFLQLTNELATQLRLPLLLSRRSGLDYSRQFATRLCHAAAAMSVQDPGALIVIAVDAADNSVAAAEARVPVEASFVHDFVRLLERAPQNVRLVITARTGKLRQLAIPPWYQTVQIEPFTRSETGESVACVWDAPEDWVEDFHHLSRGVPRVQKYAFQVGDAQPSGALDRLRPTGKSLDDVFHEQFREALAKSGSQAEVERLCAGLVALPRPVPLSALAAVLQIPEERLADVCVDLAPGIQLHTGTVSFADEDFEHFVRNKGGEYLHEVRATAADWFLSYSSEDNYAAHNVAMALFLAGRGADLLDLVERDPSPAAIKEPVLRREAELQRLRLAIKVCREAGDVVRAIRFILIGAEGLRTETALKDILAGNPDLTVRFAYETTRRLILSNPERIEAHGSLLFQRLSVDAERDDAISVREGRRLLRAWMQARSDHYRSDAGNVLRHAWEISTSDIASQVESTLRLSGAASAMEDLSSWRPRKIMFDVALSLPIRLAIQGNAKFLRALLDEEKLGPIGKLLITLPLILAGQPIDIAVLETGLRALSRRKLRVAHFFKGYGGQPSPHGQVLDAALMTCELLTSQGAADELVDTILDDFLAPELRRIDRRHEHESDRLDLLLRAYTLREARSGRNPDSAKLFAPRPSSDGEEPQRRLKSYEEHRDQNLMELVRTNFDVYRTVACALVDHTSPSELETQIRQAADLVARNEWRISQRYGSWGGRACAARALLVLFGVGYNAQLLKEVATEVYGRWCRGNEVPDAQLVTRLSLQKALHSDLVSELGKGAEQTCGMRIGADEKSKALIGYARLLLPISPDDAEAVFTSAVRAASELDYEAMAQLRLLDMLVTRGNGYFDDARGTARQVSEVITDAAIRLDGHEDFPWQEAISALTRLDVALALGNIARWDDEALVALSETLPSLLKTGLRTSLISPAQAAALNLFLHDDSVMQEALATAVSSQAPLLGSLAEEAAYDALVRHRQITDGTLIRLVRERGIRGRWTNALDEQDRFLSALPKKLPQDYPRASARAPSAQINHSWTAELLIDVERFREAVGCALEVAGETKAYTPLSDILRSAREAVLPRDRVNHLAVLGALNALTVTNEAVDALLSAIELWWDSPAVKAWCKVSLPEIIVARLPEFARYIHYRDEALSKALGCTQLQGLEISQIILRGIEAHVDSLSPNAIFALVGMAGVALVPEQAAELATWYATRLAGRVARDDRDQTAPIEQLPVNIEEAFARFIFAYLGDFDVRMRWRAAHAIRRLARLDDVSSLGALVHQYTRREEFVFRGKDVAFYWLSARLWFAIAWDRLALETPKICGCASSLLLSTALDENFPHLLVRAFARDACLKLHAAGALHLTGEVKERLSRVNKSSLPRQVKNPHGHRYFSRSDKEHRFRFDEMDTLPYWYQPMLRAFANLAGERFLNEAERWIVDVWGYGRDASGIRKERRRGRFGEHDWGLSSNRHGNIPTLERFNNHLEWHGMWCAAGELLKTEPLSECDRDDWDSLHARIERAMVTEPPLWSADILSPVPRVLANWAANSDGLFEWVEGVTEADHRAELLPEDMPDYMIVGGELERRARDRIEIIRIASALVTPEGGGSLLRALQTMDDPWSYKLPDEDEDHEIDEAPYRLLGWLLKSYRDAACDEKDPFRGYASLINASPGRRVVKAMGLRRDPTWQAQWLGSSDQSPMFIYQVWGDREKDDERVSLEFAAAGWRLLAHKQQVQKYLRQEGLDIIAEVEVLRSGRKYREYTGEENEQQDAEGRFDRLYRFQGRGTLEVVEGCVGTWSGDSSAA
ncbi:hypothetical protein FVW20_05155 [Desulfovibrio oxamicus]|uniref:NACHT domain-containing protein n=1 Tax=Nitratidesulfovibrio oxamicus TaxID=32016 RepID=A0ABS0J1X9_9BACT|nr:hypothetical protein [Nitratidesulfovibrio oxamicus]MBG3876431.1 hypothetical protein [Nitratidesulfovibrio oxamicus]